MKLIIANWKKYLSAEAEAAALAEGYVQLAVPSGVQAVACPRFEHLAAVKEKLGDVVVGAQDIMLEGEFSPEALKGLGVHYAILGHSDSRAAGDTDTIIRSKVIKTLEAGLKVILCVGEPAKIHAEGEEAIEQFVLGELESSLPVDDLDAEVADGSWTKDLYVVYEPVWAISKAGVGESDTPEDAARIITLIKEFLASRFSMPSSPVLYGASVTALNAAAFLSRPEIDGTLVGHASLDAEEFQKILDAAG